MKIRANIEKLELSMIDKTVALRLIPRFYDTKELDILRGLTAAGEDVIVEIKKYRKGRSLNANAYLWAILGEIAAVLRADKDEVYLTMLERYGVYTHIIVKPNMVDKVKKEWKTVRELGAVTVNGQSGIQLMCFFGSSTYDTREFAVLLDGVISEAKELDIDVISKTEQAKMIEEWGK